MHQLLNGLYFIHSEFPTPKPLFEACFNVVLFKILQRDMKAANVLITKSGVL